MSERLRAIVDELGLRPDDRVAAFFDEPVGA